MTRLEPNPYLLAAARRLVARQWKLDPGGDYSPDAHPALYLLWQHRYVALHYATPSRLQDGADTDRWVLTDAGRDWFAAAEEGRP